jgi:hypothetical protein
MKGVEVLELEYTGSKEATILIQWFDNEENKWIKLRGVVDEVKK